MKPVPIHSIIYAAQQAWLKGNPTGFAALFAETGAFIVPGQEWIGPAAIHTAVVDYMAHNWVKSIEIRQILADGDRALLEWHWVDQDRDTGIVHQADDAIAIDVAQGQIIHWREYIDSQSSR